MNDQAASIFELLDRAKSVAVVGASHKPWRPSHAIGEYLIEQGYRVYPVNPNETEVLGIAAAPNLQSLPAAPAVAVIFRRPETVPEAIEDAIAAGVQAVWLQEGVVHDAACARARQAGLLVVQDRCIMVDDKRRKRRP